MMQNEIKEFAAKNQEEMYEMIRELCRIPAPSGMEHQRALYCKNWLEKAGAKGVIIDDAQNVIFPLNCANSNEITLFLAHTDTVFPDVDPMPCFDDGEKLHSPGVADDTASVVVLLQMAKFFVEQNLFPEKGILFVCNSCEEGLGNLKGCKKLFEDYGHRIKQMISFDSNLNVVNDVCVGSHRYEVTIQTQGGHSYEDFGNTNAIFVASQMVNELYGIRIPWKEGTKTTCNVGTISGGTSVNTIAQNTTFLCEYRSDDGECLSYMQQQFEMVFRNFQRDDIRIEIKKAGDRPCSRIDSSKVEALKELVIPEIEAVIQQKVTCMSSSTDCNIPLSMGIPALCVGVNYHQGIHTREEWVDKQSIPLGLQIAIRLGMKLTEG